MLHIFINWKMLCNLWGLSLAVVKYDFKLIVEPYAITPILFISLLIFLCCIIYVFVKGAYWMCWMMLAYLFRVCFVKGE